MGQFLDRVKDHLKRNWGKYATAAAAAYGYNRYVGIGEEGKKQAKAYRDQDIKRLATGFRTAKQKIATGIHDTLDAARDAKSTLAVELNKEDEKKTAEKVKPTKQKPVTKTNA